MTIVQSDLRFWLVVPWLFVLSDLTPFFYLTDDEGS